MGVVRIALDITERKEDGKRHFGPVKRNTAPFEESKMQSM